MIPAPTNFPTGNSHRVALFLPEQAGTDFDRLEDLTADGLRLARSACQQLTASGYQFDRHTTANIQELTSAVEKRRLLNDRFVDVAHALIEELSQEGDSSESGEVFPQIVEDLKEAVDLSNRVRDLLAAERDVGWHRGLSD